MSHKYRDYSKPETLVKEEKIEKPAQEEVIVEAAVEESEQEDVMTTVGVVSNCERLRLRKLPNPNSQIICELNVGTKLEIDLDKSTIAFYKVCTETGVEGYCMKQYVAVV